MSHASIPCVTQALLQAVFFKMRVAGVLHIFQFETRQGEDICTALQTHINDIMMKRYNKAKQTGAADRELPQANFGPKYEQHVSSMQKSLEEAKQKMVDLEKAERQVAADRVSPPTSRSAPVHSESPAERGGPGAVRHAVQSCVF